MAITQDEARKVAHLARIAVADDALPALAAELNGILAWVEQLQAVDTAGIEPMAGGAAMPELAVLRLRDDVVTDGGMPEKVLANAPDRQGDFFTVPKVVE